MFGNVSDAALYELPHSQSIRSPTSGIKGNKLFQAAIGGSDYLKTCLDALTKVRAKSLGLATTVRGVRTRLAQPEPCKRDADGPHFEHLVARIILHRNSQVCFHKSMATEGVGKISRACLLSQYTINCSFMNCWP